MPAGFMGAWLMGVEVQVTRIWNLGHGGYHDGVCGVIVGPMQCMPCCPRIMEAQLMCCQHQFCSLLATDCPLCLLNCADLRAAAHAISQERETFKAKLQQASSPLTQLFLTHCQVSLHSVFWLFSPVPECFMHRACASMCMLAVALDAVQNDPACCMVDAHTWCLLPAAGLPDCHAPVGQACPGCQGSGHLPG